MKSDFIYATFVVHGFLFSGDDLEFWIEKIEYENCSK